MKKTTIPPTSNEQTDANAEVIKLGIDIHAKEYVVVRQTDGASPQPPQKFTPEAFIPWVKKQCARADQVVSCYEAGCFGYVLHRKLEALGVKNYVVRPRNWDEYGAKVKTDSRDARELCSHLDRYLAGNHRALTPVRVPSESEEQQRSLSRQRDTLSKERKRLQNIGTSSGRYYGIALPAEWWKPKVFEALKETLPDFLVMILAPYHQVLVTINTQLREATAREERTANRLLPVGLGALTASVLDSEFVDYERFNNRREVGSYTGLCPGEASSGGQRQQGLRKGSVRKRRSKPVKHRE